MGVEVGVYINVNFPSYLSDFNSVWNKCPEIPVQRHITAFGGYELSDVRRHICELADGEQIQRSYLSQLCNFRL